MLVTSGNSDIVAISIERISSQLLDKAQGVATDSGTNRIGLQI